MPLTRKIAAPAIASFVVGALIWAASPLVTGHVEPWDADTGYYPATLLITGILLGLLVPKNIWAHYCGALLGQLAFMLVFMEIGPLLAIGVIFLAAYTIILWLGALSGSQIRTRFFDINVGHPNGT